MSWGLGILELSPKMTILKVQLEGDGAISSRSKPERKQKRKFPKMDMNLNGSIMRNKIVD